MDSGGAPQMLTEVLCGVRKVCRAVLGFKKRSEQCSTQRRIEVEQSREGSIYLLHRIHSSGVHSASLPSEYKERNAPRRPYIFHENFDLRFIGARSVV